MSRALPEPLLGLGASLTILLSDLSLSCGDGQDEGLLDELLERLIAGHLAEARCDQVLLIE